MSTKTTLKTWIMAVSLVSLGGLVAACGGSDGEEQNQPPVAEISVSPGTQVGVGTEVNLDGSESSDPDGDSLTYEWSVTGPDSQFSQQGMGESFSFTPPNAGRYTVELAVSDGSATANDSASVFAQPQQNESPTASISGPQEVAMGNSVELIGSGSSDPEGAQLDYAWGFASGSCSAGSLGSETTNPTVTFTGDEMGSCDVELEVTDDGGQSDSATFSISVVQDEPDNQAPSVVIEGEAGWTGQNINLRAQVSDDNDSPSELTYDWSLGSTPSGAQASIQSADEQRATLTPDVAGDYVVQVTVTDTADASTDASKTFSVTERPDPVKPNAGDIWINEVMADPDHIADDQGEWVELATNASSTIFDLTGCELTDDTGEGFTIPESAPNFSGNDGYYTIAKSTNVDFTPDHTWTAVPSFNNDADTVDLDCNNQDLDSVTYDDSFPLEVGETLQLDRSVVTGSGSPASANNDPANWCAVGQQGGSGPYGTPGEENLTCSGN